MKTTGPDLKRAGPVRWRRTLRFAIYAMGLMPAAWALHLALTDQLGADPVKELERTFGLWSLRYLILGLAITPLWRLGGPKLVVYRRAVGLLAFFYATFHLTAYVWLDQDLMLAAIWRDILKRPHITVGLVAFLILIPLAVTSNDAVIKWLGAANWQRLHRWVYLAAAAAALHFIILVKAWRAEPLIYAGLIAVLLLWRAWNVSRPRADRRALQSGA